MNISDIPKQILKGIMKVFDVAVDVEKDEAILFLTKVAIIFGKAFGPDNILHFSELTHPEQEQWLERVPVLATNHKDWPKGIDWVPRTVTTFIPQPGFEIKVLGGNTTDPHPIPKRGEWWYSKGWITYTSENGLHISFGFRPDDVDNYINFPRIAFKRV